MVRSKTWYHPLGHGYTGAMYIQPALLPRAKKIRVAPALSREAKRRLRWMQCYLSHGRNAKQTYRHFGISSATFYRWWHRYDPRRLESLEDDWGTRRPRRVRQPQTPPELVARLRALRETFPRWGKTKLAVLLRREERRGRSTYTPGKWPSTPARAWQFSLLEPGVGRAFVLPSPAWPTSTHYIPPLRLSKDVG